MTTRTRYADGRDQLHRENVVQDAEPPDADAGDRLSAIEERVESGYRVRRRRLQQRARDARRRSSNRRSHVEDLLEFAKAWAPYGGPPDDELFVRYGMSRQRFEVELALATGALDVPDRS